MNKLTQKLLKEIMENLNEAEGSLFVATKRDFEREVYDSDYVRYTLKKEIANKVLGKLSIKLLNTIYKYEKEQNKDNQTT